MTQSPDADRLVALASGYFGLFSLLVVNLVLSAWLLVPSLAVLESTPTFILIVFGTCGFVFGLPSFFIVRKVGKALGWTARKKSGVTLLMILNGMFLGGAVGVFAMRQLLAEEISKFGVKASPWSVKWPEVQGVIHRLRTSDTQAVPQDFSHAPYAQDD